MRSGGVFAADGNHMSKPFGARCVRRSAARRRCCGRQAGMRLLLRSDHRRPCLPSMGRELRKPPPPEFAGFAFKDGMVRPHIGGSRSQCRQHGNHPLFFGGYVRGFPMSLAVTSHRTHPRFGNRLAVRADCPETCPYITRCVSLFHRLSSATMMETLDISTFPFLQGCFG